MTIVEHLERHLGPIAEGWNRPSRENDIQVVRFENQPALGVSTYSTLGLSDHVLQMPRGRAVREELLLAAHDRFPPGQVAWGLLALGRSIAATHVALLRGELVGAAKPLVPEATLRAVYATVPTVYQQTLATCDKVDPPIVVVWLLPVSETEAEYVREEGWEAFEDKLEASDIDLFDLERESIVR